jgi:hypothetical protein
MIDYIVFYKDHTDQVVSRAIFSAQNREDAIEQAQKRQPDAEYWLRLDTDDEGANICDFDVDAVSDWIENRKEAWKGLLFRRCPECGTDYDGTKCPDCSDDNP